MIKPRPQSHKPPTTRYFIPDKTKTDPYFKESKVNSCNHVVNQNGQLFAICYPIKNHKNRPMCNFKNKLVRSSTMKSIYKSDYEPKPSMHVGMKHKPLMPYNPTSYRSRIHIRDVLIEYRNTSHFAIGKGNLVNKKQYVSSAHDSFRQPKVVPVTNPGITSDTAKIIHKKLELIDY